MNWAAIVTKTQGLPLRAIVVVALGLALFASGWQVRGWKAEAELRQLKLEHAEAKTEATRRALVAEQDARGTERYWAAKVEEIQNHALQIAEAARLADARAVDAADRLQRAVRATAARCPATPAPSASGAAPGGPPASTPGDLLAEVHRRIDGAAGELAAGLDRAHAAGIACERVADALN